MRKLFTALEAEALEVALTAEPDTIVTPEPIMGDAADQMLFLDDVLDDEGLYAAIELNLTAAKQVGDTVDVLVSATGNGGLQQPVGEALMVAVESLLSAVGEKAPKLVFHPQANAVSRNKNLTMACEGLGSTLVTIWRKLIEMVKRLVKWFKSFSAKSHGGVVALGKKTKAAEEKVKHARKEEPSVQPKADWKFFKSHQVAGRLHNKAGVVPQGVELMRASLQHFAQMRSAYEKTYDHLVIVMRNILAAEDQISKDGGDFNMHVSSALADLQSEIFVTAGATHTSAQKGLKSYEEPLVFGARSYFRVVSNSVLEFNTSELQAKVAGTTGAVESYPEQKLYALAGKYPEELLQAVKTHVSTQTKHLNNFDKLTDALDSLVDRLEKRAKKAFASTEDEREAKRVRLLIKCQAVFAMVFKSVAVDLSNYDMQVCDALLTYAVKSVE